MAGRAHYIIDILKKRKEIMMVVIFLSAIIISYASVMIYGDINYNMGQNQGFEKGYQTGYNDGLANRLYTPKKRAPYKTGSHASKGFCAAYPLAYKDGYIAGLLEAGTVSIKFTGHENDADKKSVTISDGSKISATYELLTSGKRITGVVFEDGYVTMNDTPPVPDYMQIEIISSYLWHRYFVYEDNGKWYVDEPYEAIYSIDENTYNQIGEIFSNVNADNIGKQG